MVPPQRGLQNWWKVFGGHFLKFKLLIAFLAYCDVWKEREKKWRKNWSISSILWIWIFLIKNDGLLHKKFFNKSQVIRSILSPINKIFSNFKYSHFTLVTKEQSFDAEYKTLFLLKIVLIRNEKIIQTFIVMFRIKLFFNYLHHLLKVNFQIYIWETQTHKFYRNRWNKSIFTILFWLLVSELEKNQILKICCEFKLSSSLFSTPILSLWPSSEALLIIQAFFCKTKN